MTEEDTKEETHIVTCTNWGNLPDIATYKEALEESIKKTGINPQELIAMKNDLKVLRNFVDGQDFAYMEINNRIQECWRMANTKMDKTNLDGIYRRLKIIEADMKGVPYKIDLIMNHLGINEHVQDPYTPSLDARVKDSEDKLREQHDAISNLYEQLHKGTGLKKFFGGKKKK